MPAAKKVIQGKLPASAGPAAPANKTAQYLAGITPAHPGQQAFYREALSDIPHPLQPGQQLTYGGLQDLMAGPQRGAALEAYRVANRLPAAPAPEAMQQALFDQAKGRMLERGAQNPGALAFPEQAINALNAPVSQRELANGNPADTGTGAVSAASEAQRFANLREQGLSGGYTAPGMAMAPVASTTRRVISRSIASK